MLVDYFHEGIMYSPVIRSIDSSFTVITKITTDKYVYMYLAVSFRDVTGNLFAFMSNIWLLSLFTLTTPASSIIILQVNSQYFYCFYLVNDFNFFLFVGPCSTFSQLPTSCFLHLTLSCFNFEAISLLYNLFYI